MPAYLRTTFAGDPTFLGVKTLFTIHNLGYQGLFPADRARRGGPGPSCFPPRRHGILRPGQLHQGRHFVRRRAYHRQPHLRPRDPDTGVRLRPGRRFARARRRAHRHPERRRLPGVESGERPADSRVLLGAAI